ncbi:MAG: hypothetical protein WBB28_01675 [Crinalium sp.]
MKEFYVKVTQKVEQTAFVKFVVEDNIDPSKVVSRLYNDYDAGISLEEVIEEWATLNIATDFEKTEKFDNETTIPVTEASIEDIKIDNNTSLELAG